MRYPKDLTGQKFGRLTVIGPAEPYIMPNGDKMTRWVCRCDCGKEITAKRRSLVNGDRKSCGCLKLENHESCKRDLVGQRFGRLVAIRPANEPYITPSGKKHRRWICRCDCGNEVIVNQKSLLYGTTRSCGCIRHDISETIESEMAGKRFGRLTVMGQSEKIYISPSGKSRERLWDCKCDCGNIISVRRTLLLNGHTKSCGCLRSENSAKAKKDLTGQKFGRWTALKRVPLIHPDSKGRRNGWLCRCDCGTERIVETQYLLDGTSKSCGCLSREVYTARFDPNGDNVLGQYEGTMISIINPERKLNSNNTSGVRGVSWRSRDNVWTASIGVQGRRIHLGYFAKFEDAVAARKAAEEKYYEPIIEAYNAEKEKRHK